MAARPNKSMPWGDTVDDLINWSLDSKFRNALGHGANKVCVLPSFQSDYIRLGKIICIYFIENKLTQRTHMTGKDGERRRHLLMNASYFSSGTSRTALQRALPHYKALTPPFSRSQLSVRPAGRIPQKIERENKATQLKPRLFWLQSIIQLPCGQIDQQGMYGYKLSYLFMSSSSVVVGIWKLTLPKRCLLAWRVSIFTVNHPANLS